MKNLAFALVAILGLVCPAYSQYTSIQFDLEKNYFNEGQPLPAEKPLMFTGALPEGVNIVEIFILPSNVKRATDHLYQASWKMIPNNVNTIYSLAINYALKASQKYDFRINYFAQIDGEQKEVIVRELVNLTSNYLAANIKEEKGKIVFGAKEKKMMTALDDLIISYLQNYRNQSDIVFQGLSQAVFQKLNQLAEKDFGKLPTDSTAQQEMNRREIFVVQQMEHLRAMIKTEISQLMNQSWSQLSMSRYIDDYETEQKKGFFTINAGYGGVYLDGNLDDLVYGSAPYLGIALPLSNSSIAPKFLRNSSVTLGAFLQNFEDEAGNEVSGFLVGRPFYLGLDYKLFKFIRFNTGASFLKKIETQGLGTDNIKTNNQLLIRPFVGLSARIDLSIGFGK